MPYAAIRASARRAEYQCACPADLRDGEPREREMGREGRQLRRALASGRQMAPRAPKERAANLLLSAPPHTVPLVKINSYIFFFQNPIIIIIITLLLLPRGFLYRE